MKTSSNGIALIKHFEGCKLRAYKCPAGVWTIGYGHTMDVEQGDVITPQQAELFLIADLERYENVVKNCLKSLTQQQFDALVSFCYNVGTGSFANSNLLKLAKKNPDNPAIGAEFLKWNKANVGGVLKELSGLTRRRKAECYLYFNNELKF